jgi:hypothetical protein
MAVDTQHGRCPLFWILLQERVPECQEKSSPPPSIITFIQDLGLRNSTVTQIDCQDVAQRVSPQGGSAHLADLQQRAAGGHLAPDHGNSSPLQRM